MIRNTFLSLLTIILTADISLAENQLVSVHSDGTQADNSSYSAVASHAGRFVAIGSLASNLADTDTNTVADIFVHDTLNKETELISVTDDGTLSDANTIYASISDDGRYVAFNAGGSLWAPEEGGSGICIKDRETKSLERIKLLRSAEEGYYSHGSEPDISADGSLVVFHAAKQNPWLENIFLYDRINKTSTQLTDGDDSSHTAVISANKQYIAFYSEATNLVPNDSNTGTDTFVYDLQSATFERVSVATGGAQATGNDLDYEGNIGYPAISGDGRYVVFMSKSANLVPNDTNGHRDIFVHDRQSGTTDRVSVSTDGEQANEDSNWPDISQDGRFIVFFSSADNLVADDTNNYSDIFVHDRVNGVTARVAYGNHSCSFPSISPDGTRVVYESYASDLVENDNNSKGDIFSSQNPLTGTDPGPDPTPGPNPSPDPDPSDKLTLKIKQNAKRKNFVLRGVCKDADGNPFAETPINIYKKRKSGDILLASVNCTANGKYKSKQKKKGWYKVENSSTGTTTGWKKAKTN